MQCGYTWTDSFTRDAETTVVSYFWCVYDDHARTANLTGVSDPRKAASRGSTTDGSRSLNGHTVVTVTMSTPRRPQHTDSWTGVGSDPRKSGGLVGQCGPRRRVGRTCPWSDARRSDRSTSTIAMLISAIGSAGPAPLEPDFSMPIVATSPSCLNQEINSR